MGRYFRRRLLTAIPVFFGITFLVFVLLSLSPADVTDLGEGASGGAQQAALEEALGLDKPLPVRYLAWLGGLLRGELGQSYLSGRPVAGMLAQRVGPSLLLTGTGVLLAILLALPLGILAAWRPRSGWDRAASALSLVSFGVPGFFLCLVGVLLFSVLLGWLPSQGMYEYGVFTGVGDVLRHLALPAGWCASAAWGSWSSRPAPPAWSPWGRTTSSPPGPRAWGSGPSWCATPSGGR